MMSFYPSYKKQFDSLNNKQKKTLNKIPYLEKIDGWLLLIEAIELFDLSIQIKIPDPIICEIGTWKGKSSYVFASAIKEKNGILYAVDPFSGEGDEASGDTYHKEIKKIGAPLLKNFEKTMTKYGLRQYIKVIPLPSEEARLKFFESKINLLFVDGNHKYESVKKDYELWSGLIPSGGTIVLHDVKAAHVDGPKRVMEEYISNSPSCWKNVRIVGEMAVATRI